MVCEYERRMRCAAAAIDTPPNDPFISAPVLVTSEYLSLSVLARTGKK